MFIRVWQSKLHRSVRYSTFYVLWRIVDPTWVHITMKLILLLCHVIVLNYILFIYESNFCRVKLPTWKHINMKIMFFQLQLMWFFTIEAIFQTLCCCHLAAQFRTCWDFIENNCVKQTLFKFKSISTKLHFS